MKTIVVVTDNKGEFYGVFSTVRKAKKACEFVTGVPWKECSDMFWIGRQTIDKLSSV